MAALVGDSLPVSDHVKKSPRAATTRISSKHQVTIPIDAFAAAGLQPGDTVQADVLGPGRVVLTRQAQVLDEFSGALSSGGDLRGAMDELRDEWA